MKQYKCCMCGKQSVVLYRGYSLCTYHHFEEYVNYQYEMALTAKKLKKYTKITDIPTKQRIRELYYPQFVKLFGIPEFPPKIEEDTDTYVKNRV